MPLSEAEREVLGSEANGQRNCPDPAPSGWAGLMQFTGYGCSGVELRVGPFWAFLLSAL